MNDILLKLFMTFDLKFQSTYSKPTVQWFSTMNWNKLKLLAFKNTPPFLETLSRYGSSKQKWTHCSSVDSNIPSYFCLFM